MSIPELFAQLKIANEAERVALATGHIKGQRGAVRQAMRKCRDIRRQIERERKIAIRDFAKSKCWRASVAVWESLAYLAAKCPADVDVNLWCENCGGHCRAPIGDSPCTYSGAAVVESRRYADCDSFYKGSSRGRGTHKAVLLHTRHPFELCMVYAYRAGLIVEEFEYSWYGYATAALFTRPK